MNYKIPNKYKKLNKKAQLGKIISSFPTLLILIAVMALFILLATGFSTFIERPGPSNSTQITTPEDNLLLQKIEIEFENKNEKMLIEDLLLILAQDKYDGIFENNRIELNDVSKSLKNLLTEENDCIYLHAKPVYDRDYILKDKKAISMSSNTFWTINELITTRWISLEDRKIKVTHYYGPCP